MTIKVAINGFGRIGRTVLRAMLERPDSGIQCVAVNDMFPIETLAHLLKYDSVHGTLHEQVSVQGDELKVGNQTIRVLCQKDPKTLPWKDLSVDVVYESTGRLAKRHLSQAHIDAGAKKVIISAPAGTDVDATIVYGVNHNSLTGGHSIISNASCTTNCLAPLVAPLHETFGLKEGLMTTIHAYTNDQMLTDSGHGDLHRARAAGLSMIPTKTGAAAAIGLVIPELAGRLDGLAIRVPTANVSLVDLTCTLESEATVNQVHQCLKKASEGPMKNVLAINEQPLVSIDFNHNPASSIVDFTQTRMTGKTTFKLLAWYDNEWGFSNRMLDTTTALMTAHQEHFHAE